MKKSKGIVIRLTEEELKDLKTDAYKNMMPMAVYIRYLIMKNRG